MSEEDLVSISSTIYAPILRSYFGAKKLQTQMLLEEAKACGVVVRASDSQLGDPGSNLGSAKSLSMIG